MPLDRAAHRRHDDAWLREALDRPETRLVPVWRSRNLVAEGRPPTPLRPTVGEHPALLEAGGAPVFLGLDGEVPVFAVDLSPVEDPGALGLPGAFHDLRRAGAFMDPADFGPLAYARGILRWHRKNRHCRLCGARTAQADAGFARICEGCGDKEFPRTDPAVMILVVRGDRVLLARQPRFPPGMYSALAGFVEPGESLEDCVRRETLEEVGLEVGELTYFRSQGWPFPRSLMIGFEARATSDAFRLDDPEIEEARWFSREELRAPKGFFYPPPMSLAHHLVQRFLRGGTDAAP
ncbi:MAG TPA: NAD(+) diphosphatase [Polyangiaceae bacterium LLY-WYZ-15_(1-7)]|nr:NAD(+) diphosphatase [Sandaracinus sp.]HJL03037.1 NAD(+) diphosphatase [Polyangiaceae bacterium LLY-WYZ-15_(1-7)]HJL10233.1 NAD(+) diphosphatase [Polyangiaceae bacterium LLY-WYZ-15_(1-7)]HJL20935.1 NAD(+) diphosphatase [Polyangiaceae bacterium LLY-WYZ-15_(1-7)]HJL30890.1 NAD(+) diphosphatase [Polyangiaceae bacterium LLY-WYZ-15_(1-7)]